MYSTHLRILCALAAMAGFYKATTPPHGPPFVDEKAPSTNLEILLKQRLVRTIVKTICWAGALSEIAIVLSNEYPSSLPAKRLLAMLPKPQCHDRLHASSLFFLGTFMTILGGYTRVACYKALGKFFTFEMSIRDDHKLITDGPYGVVRHPGYSGVVLAVTGIIVWHASPGSWFRECGILQTGMGKAGALTYLGLTTSIVIGLLYRMRLEDAALKKVFGDQWDAWAKKVPYKLIPWIY